jgi:hypothetical protein
MTWNLVGYFPKRRTTRAGWVSPWPNHPDPGFPCAPPVEEICSVSDCIAHGPEGWPQQWKHNPYAMYDGPALAWSIVPANIRSDYELFAYRLLQTQFIDGRDEPMEEWCELSIQPMPASFVRLGWDAVEGGNYQGFGCSPLTCNNQAGNFGRDASIPEVNRYALAATENDGIRLARHFSITKPEPGPYAVVEVWREEGANRSRIGTEAASS